MSQDSIAGRAVVLRRSTTSPVSERWKAERDAGGVVFDLPVWRTGHYSYGHANLRRVLQKAELEGIAATPAAGERHVKQITHAGCVMGLEHERIVVSGANLAFGAWTLIGTAEPRSAAVMLAVSVDPNRRQALSEHTLNTLNAGGPFDRCAATRRAIATRTSYLMQSSDGRLEVFSRRGLKLRFGSEAGAEIAGVAGRLERLLGTLGQFEVQPIDKVPSGERLFQLEWILAHAAQVVREQGQWLSRAKAGDQEPSAERLRARVRAAAAGAFAPTPSAEDVAAAEAMKATMCPSGQSEYVAKVRRALTCGWVSESDVALVGAAYGTAQARAAEQLTQATRARSPSQHIGELGQRVVTAVRVERVGFLGTSDFGSRYANVLRDLHGNLLLWRSGRALNQGQWYELSATIARHEAYGGELQTVLRNCRERTIQEE